MYQPHHDLLNEASEIYLRLVPSLSREVAAEMPPDFTEADWNLVQSQVCWAAIASAADRLGLTPAEYSIRLLRFRDREKSLSYWQAANAAIKPTS